MPAWVTTRPARFARVTFGSMCCSTPPDFPAQLACITRLAAGSSPGNADVRRSEIAAAKGDGATSKDLPHSLGRQQLMEQLRNSLLTELRSLIAELGKDGGRMSASVYETAQVLRFCPPRDRMAVVEWLLARQAADGGWGDPLAPL